MKPKILVSVDEVICALRELGSPTFEPGWEDNSIKCWTRLVLEEGNYGTFNLGAYVCQCREGIEIFPLINSASDGYYDFDHSYDPPKVTPTNLQPSEIWALYGYRHLGTPKMSVIANRWRFSCKHRGYWESNEKLRTEHRFLCKCVYCGIYSLVLGEKLDKSVYSNSIVEWCTTSDLIDETYEKFGSLNLLWPDIVFPRNPDGTLDEPDTEDEDEEYTDEEILWLDDSLQIWDALKNPDLERISEKTRPNVIKKLLELGYRVKTLPDGSDEVTLNGTRVPAGKSLEELRAVIYSHEWRRFRY